LISLLTWKDIDKLEAVQHRATRMIPGMAKYPYEERLRRLDLPSLVYRRTRGDAIEVYKYMHGIYKTDYQVMLPLHESAEMSTIGNSMKLKKQASNIQLRLNFFSFRVVNMWNSLPEDVVNAPSVNCFKGRFDRYCYSMKFAV
jgi:ribonuclease P/MRP protein subunit RPP40